MSDASRRELAVAAISAATLSGAWFLSRNAHGLAFGVVVMLLVSVWQWRRGEELWLRPRIAATALAGFAGFGAAAFAAASIGTAVVVLAIAVVAAARAFTRLLPLRGGPLPGEGEARGRVTFEGTVHAIGEAVRVPGTLLMAPLWIAQQGRRRWTSPHRVELRDEHRRVVAEPVDAVAADAPWVMEGAIGREAAKELDGADPTRPIRMWRFAEGSRTFVIGTASIESDPSAPSLRDPGRVYAFAGALVVGDGQRRDARRDAMTRLLVWSGVAAAAGAVAVLG